MMGYGMMDGFGGGWFMSIFGVLFLVLIIWPVVALIRGAAWYRDPDSSYSRPDSALEVLKRRYARGEISREEYEGKKRDLL